MLSANAKHHHGGLVPWLPRSFVLLAACLPDRALPSGTTGDTTSEVTAQDTGGTGLGTTGAPSETSGTNSDLPATSDTTDALQTTGTTGAVPDTDCAFLPGHTFLSDEMMECVNPKYLCTWQIAFGWSLYIQSREEPVDDGDITCEDGSIVGVSSSFGGMHAGTIEAETGRLVWDGVVYHVLP